MKILNQRMGRYNSMQIAFTLNSSLKPETRQTTVCLHVSAPAKHRYISVYVL